MQIDVRLSFPVGTAGAARMLADPQYVHTKVRASGALDQQVDVTGDAEGAFTVTTRRALPSEQIPAHARALVGSRIDVRQVEAWEAPTADGSRAGTVVVEIAGAPVRVTGRASLAPGEDGASTQVRYVGEVRATVPLFAAAVEDAAAGAVRSVLEVEQEVARRWLAQAPDAPGDAPAPPARA
ncbi:DUF2505 domain-containing protein [Cellulomonas oligotrophica]|uniref:DUF2505 domain-containing protein n=1 Tax=Cellulomonas oligotrophica TaxID=931536 RepID=A0A7Y9FD96_9CELL|nr:DUF2505 domain-containing protein [Cellulomonas oligotrophica]NYD85256.1 hypothetical protein [Cellulomonas oligotrophica]GIG33308.1 hypothetical protein Col01nite_24670 [Cellulomonas oligotrophica]